MTCNQNGQLILQTLESLEEPATIARITKQVADAVGADVDDVKDSVQQTLDGGVRFGYVQRVNKKYLLNPVELPEMVDDGEQNNVDDNQINIGREVQDRARRRRPRRAGRRRSRRRRRR